MFSRAIHRLAFPLSNRVLAQARPAYRFCSNLSKDGNQVKQKLLKVVEKESTYENENYSQDQGYHEYLEKNGFTIKETEGDPRIELYKEKDGVQMIISFQSRAPNLDQPEEAEEGQSIQPQSNQAAGQEDQQQEPNPEDMEDFSEFTIYLKKPSGQTLVVECSSAHSEVQISYLHFVSDYQKHIQVPRYFRGANEYQGPDFQTLDERLQVSFQQYLKTFGVNEELAAFIEHYSLDKEQRLYMSWLQQFQTFLKN